jgi:hypothetical protein
MKATTKQLLASVSTLAAGVGGGEAVERPRHHLEIAATYDRCRSLFGAVCLLLASGFVHEAVILVRPLFTDSLMLAEMAALEEPRRLKLIVAWWLDSLAELEGTFREARSRGDDVTTELAHIQQRRGDLHEYARERGIRTRKWRPDRHAKALASKHGRGGEYVDLLITHHFVHGSTLAGEQRYSRDEDDAVAVGGPAADLETWAPGTAHFAATSMLHATRAVCEIFRWPEPPELERLLQHVLREHARVDGDE